MRRRHQKTTVNQRDYIFLKADKKHYKVNLAEIFYFESMGDYVIAFTNQKKIVTKERIGNIPEMLPVNEFLQIHRRYIVSVRKIESLGPGFIEINGIKLPVGRQFKASFPDFFKMINSI
jgi:DNA-binding LytR/AlgR family response regulator